MRDRIMACFASVLLVAACGDTSVATIETTVPADSDVATGTPAATSTTVAAVTTVPTTTTTEPTPATAPAEFIGEPYDTFVPVPGEGPVIAVVGVHHDDVLNVRSGPGISYEVVTTLIPITVGIAGTGEGWQLPSGSVWWKIEADGAVGWANQTFLSRLGGVDDMTSQVVDRFGGTPTADNLRDLAFLVGAAIVDADLSSAEAARRGLYTRDIDFEVSVAPTEGDLSEVTYDMVGFGDDSLGGYRLHIFAQPTEDGGMALMSVEATTFCQRGLSGELCA